MVKEFKEKCPRGFGNTQKYQNISDDNDLPTSIEYNIEDNFIERGLENNTG